MTENSAGTSINWGSVNNASQALTDAFDTISAIINDTQTAISPLQETWSGVSEQEYEGVQSRWSEDLQLLQDALNRCVGMLDQMAVNAIQDPTFPLPGNT